jgi:hypothetical protein
MTTSTPNTQFYRAFARALAYHGAITRMLTVYGRDVVGHLSGDQLYEMDQQMQLYRLGMVLTQDEWALYNAMKADDPHCTDGMTPKEFIMKMDRFAQGLVD